MSILSGPEIGRIVEATKKAIQEGLPLPYPSIDIDPFDAGALGPNSYDVRLGEWLVEIADLELDLTKAPERTRRFAIPPEGFLLTPRVGYLGHTVETIECRGIVPWLDSRSTAGRFFLQTHMTAGRGDTHWRGQYTLELMATHRPLRIYAGLRVAQVSFLMLEGEPKPYQGRYNDQMGPTLPKPLTR